MPKFLDKVQWYEDEALVSGIATPTGSKDLMDINTRIPVLMPQQMSTEWSTATTTWGQTKFIYLVTCSCATPDGDTASIQFFCSLDNTVHLTTLFTHTQLPYWFSSNHIDSKEKAIPCWGNLFANKVYYAPTQCYLSDNFYIIYRSSSTGTSQAHFTQEIVFSPNLMSVQRFLAFPLYVNT